MTIVGTIQVESRRFSGWTDPRYPIGFWQAALVLTGDASGGTLSIELIFQTANGPERLNSQMYSVERFSATTTDDATKEARIAALNMGGPANVGFSNAYNIRLQNHSIAGAGSSVNGDELVLCPWFLGSQRLPGIVANLSLALPNINSEINKFEAEGYRWSARSVLVDGGPQRPPTGLYRQ